MANWGPGSPDEPQGALNRAKSESEGEETQSPSNEEKSSEEADSGSNGQSDLFAFEAESDPEGSARETINSGEYAFLPVFGFNEANIAARKYTKKHGLEDEDSTINLRDDEPLTIGGRELTWWEDNSIIPKYPYMLINPLGFAAIDPDVHNFRDVFRVTKGEHFVFSDSGGYQLMSMDDAEIVDSIEEHSFSDYQIYPERLMEWQVHNADAGATIDYPPYNISGDSSFPDKTEHTEDWRVFYRQRRDQSHAMTKRMAGRLKELRESGDKQAQDYIFAPVIHGKPKPDGYTQYYVSRWHDEMMTGASHHGVEPRGWVLKPEPSSSFGQIALFLGYASEYLDDAEFIHVLMVGGHLQKTLLQYYAMNSDHFVTSDASSYAAGGMRRQFYLPGTSGRRSVIISSRDEDDENAAKDANRLERYPCRCSVCSIVERELGFDFITNGSGSARNVTMNMHNLHQILNVERTLNALLREDQDDLVETGGDPTGSEFWRFCSTITKQSRLDDLYRAMDYVRLAQQEGLSEANRQYRILWDSSGGKTITRASGSASRADWN